MPIVLEDNGNKATNLIDDKTSTQQNVIYDLVGFSNFNTKDAAQTLARALIANPAAV